MISNLEYTPSWSLVVEILLHPPLSRGFPSPIPSQDYCRGGHGVDLSSAPPPTLHYLSVYVYLAAEKRSGHRMLGLRSLLGHLLALRPWQSYGTSVSLYVKGGGGTYPSYLLGLLGLMGPTGTWVVGAFHFSFERFSSVSSKIQLRG